MKEPQGIAFFNVKSGDTHYAKLEPTIQAYINSSDMGVNASRGQDFGWKLAPEWVEKVKKFRKDEAKMEVLSARYGGNPLTTPQILRAIYAEEVRAYEQQVEDEDSPFEEEYQQRISGKSEPQPEEPAPADPTPEEVEAAVASKSTPKSNKQ